jgi:predicted lipid carrier protein YhbT
VAVAFDTETLARMVREMPDDALREGIRRNRDVLLAEVFRRFPERLTSAGRRQNAVIKWRIGGREDGGFDHWFVVLRDGTCEVGRDLGLKPRLTLQLDALDFLKLGTGNVNPVRLFLRRRLRVRGDLRFAARMQSLFAVPR